MRGILLCAALMMGIPTVDAATQACDENTPRWANAACLYLPALENGHVIVGGDMACAGGISKTEASVGVAGVVVYTCPIRPFGPGFDPVRDLTA